MPLEIVRNDITNMQVDAVVNSANPRPVIGSGVDAAIHKKAGSGLLKARRKIGNIAVGQAAVTPGFNLDAEYVIHTVGPVWRGGMYGEAEQLAGCCRSALARALELGCDSIAFPLLSTGNYGFPRDLALKIVRRELASFLQKHELQIYLVVYDRESFVLSEKLFQSAFSYIDENYVNENHVNENYIDRDYEEPMFQAPRSCQKDPMFQVPKAPSVSHAPSVPHAPSMPHASSAPSMSGASRPHSGSSQIRIPDFLRKKKKPETLEEILDTLDAGFSETLLTLIDRTGKKDSEVYKKANVDRKLFSKIRNNPSYQPSKTTALAFAFALELNLEETRDFIGRAGFALSHSSKLDLIVEFFLEHENYDIFELNEVLFKFDQPLIGAQ